MNDLEQLRSTLDSHADGVVDRQGGARVDAVRHRVRGVRRRRQAAVAGSAVAVLAVVGGISVLPDRDGGSPEPATDLVGVTPPAELRSLGYTYEYADGVEGTDGRTVLRLPASDEPRLVSWATSGEDDEVQINTSKSEGSVTYTDADFTNWTVVPAGYPVRVRAVAAAGDPGLAVYTVTDERPAGATSDGATFRQQITDGELVDAEIGEVGQSEVFVSGVATSGETQYSYFCADGPDDAWLHFVDADGSRSVEGPGCVDTDLVDPAGAGGRTLVNGPGDEVSQRIYVTQGRNGPRVESTTIRLGVAMYAVETEAPPNRFTSEEFEHDGHRWSRVDLQTRRVGDGPLVATAPDDGSAVLALAESTGGAGLVTIGFEGDPTGHQSFGGGGTYQLVSPGGRVTVRSRDPRNRDALFRVAFYERAD